MRVCGVAGLMALAMLSGCSRGSANVGGTAQAAAAAASVPAPTGAVAGGYAGFDRNEYPGDATMAGMHASFAFVGYWLTVPPGAMVNQWVGKRAVLRQQGWGFLVLANGRLDAEILKAQKKGIPATALGRSDAATAVAAAKNEGFPPHTIVFLDQEEGGRLLDEQAAYLLGWTEAVAGSDYRPGVYASGQLTEDGPGVMIDTIEDIRARVKAGRLHEVAMFDAQDTCPPAAGCSLAARPLKEAGEPDLIAWQYSQSPRRPELTKSCAQTYAADGNCYAPGVPGVFLDMDMAGEADPSHGR